MGWDGHGYPPYVPVAQRRANAARELARLVKKSGTVIEPVTIEVRTIAATVWGKAWCANLEGYRDYAHRLERGRTYVRNGSVVHLGITPGVIDAHVAGSELYRTRITITAVHERTWGAICGDCAGGIDSLVELLAGRLSTAVMQRLCRAGDGLFPAPDEIDFSCSCPDHAAMCKHVAAVLYGVGARLDARPELLCRLRQVEPAALLARAAARVRDVKPVRAGRRLADAGLGALFGLDLVEVVAPDEPPTKPRRRPPAKKPPARRR